MDLHNKILGSLFGFVIGDALGVPVEFMSRYTLNKNPIMDYREYGTHKQPLGTWSDDTSLMLCLIDAIIQNEIDLKLICNNFVNFYDEGKFTPHGKVFDIGHTTKVAIKRMKKGCNPVECGEKHYKNNGNGSLMRILPLSFYFYYHQSDNNNMIKLIEDISSLTHRNEISKLACIIYTIYVLTLLKTNDKIQSLDFTIDFINTNCLKYKKYFKNFNRILKKDILYLEKYDIESSGYVIDTLEASLWCFINSKSYEESVLKAVNLGEDTDTIGAITGGLSGLYYGYDNISDKWVEPLVEKNYLLDLFEKYYHKLEQGNERKEKEI